MRIAVIGDIMLDINYNGQSSRLAPEGPVPVVKINDIKYRLGGAGNVLNNLVSLGHDCIIISVIGKDDHGKIIKDIVSEKKCDNYLIIKNRKTTVKNRIFIESYLNARFDIETSDDVIYTQDEEDKILEEVKKSDVVVISDYMKGFLTKDITTKIIKLANDNNKITIVDPKDPHYIKYYGCTIIKPNKQEAEGISGMKAFDYKTITEDILNKTGSDICIMTLSGDGIYVNTNKKKGYNEEFYSTIIDKIDVIDVTGAGDCVLSGFIHKYLSTNNIIESVKFSNYCGQLKVKHKGTYTLKQLDELMYDGSGLISVERLDVIRERMKNKKIVFTNGCFDILHYGHLTYLEDAKKMGDILIVGLNTDESIKINKGKSRPVNCLKYRIKQLLSLKFIDYVVVFEQPTPLEIIKKLRPDILVKGGDYKIEDIVGKEYAIETKVLHYIDGISTTKILELTSSN
jgi:D-beta-D-heptose 7-phosphate kinase/D-beta-D-heptose 1-phosphate adenosyltransferase